MATCSNCMFFHDRQYSGKPFDYCHCGLTGDITEPYYPFCNPQPETEEEADEWDRMDKAWRKGNTKIKE